MVARAYAESGPLVIAAIDLACAKPEGILSLDNSSSPDPLPGAKFAATSLDVTVLSSNIPKPEDVLDVQMVPDRLHDRDERAIGDLSGGGPDFKSAMKKSAARKADADKSLDKILTFFEGTPARKRAAKKVQKEIASVFSDE